MKYNIKIGLVFLLVLPIFMNFVYSTACVGIGGGGYKLTAAKESPVYFTFTIYNNNPDKSIVCDPGRYIVELNIQNNDINKLFAYRISENNIYLKNNEYKEILVTLIPLIDSGNYTISVVVNRDSESQGTKIMPKTTTKFDVEIGDYPTQRFSELPEWYVAKKAKEKKAFILAIILWSLIIIAILVIIYFLIFKKIRAKNSKKW